MNLCYFRGLQELDLQENSRQAVGGSSDRGVAGVLQSQEIDPHLISQRSDSRSEESFLHNRRNEAQGWKFLSKKVYISNKSLALIYMYIICILYI